MPLADGHGAANPEDPEWVPWTFERMVHERHGAWFSSKEIAELMAPVLDGLQAISDAGLVHRDVKPANILFLGGRPCLADISLLGEDSTSITRRGTPGYAAPSWYVESGGSPDMFGAATTLYTLLTGNAPDKLGRSRFWWPPQGEASLSTTEHLEWKRMHAVIRRAVEEKPGERFVDFRAFGESCEGISRPSRPTMPHQSEPPASVTQTRSEPVSAGKVRRRKSCIMGFVLGVLGLFAWFIPLIGFPVTITGLVLSLNGLRSPMTKLASAGISMNTIFLVITIINSAVGFILGWTGRLDSFKLF
jgi:serine/threonine protein kinase